MVCILTICLPLFASDDGAFHVGIIALQEEAKSLLSSVEEAGTHFAPTLFIPDDSYATYLSERPFQRAQQVRQEAISKAYAAKSLNQLLKAQQIVPLQGPSIEGQLSIVYEQVPFDQDVALFLSEYEEARQWYASSEGYDALLLVEVQSIASYDRMRLFWYDRFLDTTSPLLDTVIISAYDASLQQAIAMALFAKSTGGGYGYLQIEDGMYNLTITVDDKPFTQQAVPIGEHRVRMSKPGFEEQVVTLTILENTLTRVVPELQALVADDVVVRSNTGKVQWFLDGLPLAPDAEITLLDVHYPITLVAKKDGFSSTIISLQNPAKSLDIALKPAWMDDSSLMRNEQEGFYKSLRNTMLIFGLYVASNTASRTFEQASPLWQPLQVATSGLALVSALHTIMNLASYVGLSGSSAR